MTIRKGKRLLKSESKKNNAYRKNQVLTSKRLVLNKQDSKVDIVLNNVLMNVPYAFNLRWYPF